MRRAVAAASMALMAATSPVGTLLQLINRARARAHVAQLHDNRRLTRVARACTENVLPTCSRQLGVRVRTLGENTAAYVTAGPREAVELWMESAPHRANILDPHWRATGLAVLRGTTYVEVFAP
jgi:uncharacterized protein YkwD